MTHPFQELTRAKILITTTGHQIYFLMKKKPLSGGVADLPDHCEIEITPNDFDEQPSFTDRLFDVNKREETASNMGTNASVEKGGGKAYGCLFD